MYNIALALGCIFAALSMKRRMEKDFSKASVAY